MKMVLTLTLVVFVFLSTTLLVQGEAEGNAYHGKRLRAPHCLFVRPLRASCELPRPLACRLTFACGKLMQQAHQ